MKTALRGILLILMLSVLSCGKDGIRARIAGIENLPSDERFVELLKLNEEYPDSPLIKLRLGNLLTEHDNPETALIYLSSALRLESALNNDEERAELYAAGSRAALDSGELADALSWARRAFELSPRPAPALALGLALARSGDGKAALSPFAEAYGRDKSLFGTEESRRYAELLATSGDYAKALDIVRESLAINGYYPGAGAEESASSLSRAGGKRPFWRPSGMWNIHAPFRTKMR
jgi:tetratricopeptide (TPR) repeat protein